MTQDIPRRILNNLPCKIIIDDVLYVRLSLICIWLNVFLILSSYNSAYPSIVDYPINISQTPENVIIEYYSFNHQIVTIGEKIYTVWQEDKGLVVDIYFRRSTDGGASFDKTINLSNNIGEARNPHIAVSGNTVYVTWLQITGNTTSIDLRRSTDGGASFAKTINLANITNSPHISETRYPSIVASGSDVHVIWLDNARKSTGQSSRSVLNNSTNPTADLLDEFGSDTLPKAEEEETYEDIFYRRSTDGGASFDKTINLSDNMTLALNPHITVADSNVYVVWNGGEWNEGEGNDGIYLRRSTDGGASFEPIVNVVNNSENATSWLRNTQVSSSDTNVYIIYEQRYEYSEGKKPKLFFTASNNTGTTFGRPIMLSDDNGLEESSDIVAHMYSSGSNVYVVWPADTIDDDPYPSRSDIYFRRSTDGGASFEPIVNLSENFTKGISSIPIMTANGSILYIAWDVGVTNGVLARSRDEGSNFDISTNVTGSNTRLSISEGNAALLWTEDGEIFFRKVLLTLPVSSMQHTKVQSAIVVDQTPIEIDGRIGSTEWQGIPEYYSGFGLETTIRSDIAQLNDKMYEVKLASTYDNNNSYIVVGVQSTDFKGGSNIALMFDSNNNGRLDNGDDILRIRGLNYTNSIDRFEDSFWNNVTNDIQKDEDYEGKQDGYAASSFYDGTEVFEISHPLCSDDIDHDYCITPDEKVGFALKLEINSSSTLLFFNEEYNGMFPLSLSKGGVYGIDPCPNCQSLARDLVPPATFILDPFIRLSEYERAEFLGNLTGEEQTELLTSPTFQELQDFLLNKLSAEKLGDFLLNKLSVGELDFLFNEISKDEILNRLSDEDRKAVSDKLSSSQLTQ
jgi:hypothetical protein